MKENVRNKTITSPHNSKSSRSIRTKVSMVNEKQPFINKGPYFRTDAIRDQVNQRVNRYRSKSVKQIQQKISVSPNNAVKKQKQLIENQQYNHLDRANLIVENLLNRHQKVKAKLLKIKQERQKQIKQQHPFKPKINSQSNRYQFSDNMIRRNQIWLRQKRRKQLELRQKITFDNLENCSFSPQFSSKKQSEMYLKSRNQSRLHDNSHNKGGMIFNNNNNYNKSDNKRHSRDYTIQQYQLAKRQVLTRITLEKSYFG